MTFRPTAIATGRDTSFLAQDLNRHAEDLQKLLHNARICVIGGAGSIGNEVTRRLSAFDLSDLVVIDQDENGLAHLTRTLQSAPEKPKARHISTLPLDYGSAIARQFFEQHAPFDFVLNFAALKHVRTEKNVFSALSLLDVNALRQHDLLGWLSAKAATTHYFSVSTDKAANPVSIMGASKKIMEHVIFGSTVGSAFRGRKVSARFANVAYSNGSLLESFVQRLVAGVPLAAPVGISRYFVSQEEAGDLCLLAALLGETDSIYLPRLSAEENLVPVEEIARRFLEANGFEAEIFTLDEEVDAKFAVEGLAKDRKWPLILTPADTAGEKPYEEFVSAEETAHLSAFNELLQVRYAAHMTASEIDACLAELKGLVAGNTDAPLTMDRLKAIIADFEPAFLEAHIVSDQKLDDRI